MAAPFVEGRLRNTKLEVEIATQCAQSDQSIRLTVDSDLKFNVDDARAQPLVFEPEVDWSSFSGPNIIKAY